MWIFTPFGFFSIVRKPDDPQLTVRSRTLGDLQRLRRHYLPKAPDPVAHEGSDYPWRTRCHAGDLAAALEKIASDIDYANFKDEVALVTGKGRATRYARVWSALHGMPEDLAEPVIEGWEGLPWASLTSAGPPHAFGGVVFAPDGRLLLREVANHYGGYVWSYAKGRPDPGEAPRQTALREVQEEMGVSARLLLPLPAAFGGTTTRSHFFLMTVDPGQVDLAFRCKETARLCWAWPDEARDLLSQSTSVTGRQRDLAILDAALACLPGPLPLRRQIARREHWRTRPFPARCRALDFQRSFTPQEMRQVVRGFTPTVMEEKWFVYLEDSILHFHRSWTGNAVYRLWIEPVPAQPGHWRVWRAQASRHPGQWASTDDEQDLATLRDLVDHLLIDFGEAPTVAGLAEAVRALGEPNYLGQPAVVTGLVEPLLNTMLLGFAGGQMYEAVQARIAEITAAMTEDPAYTRMPWHSRDQLGQSLVGLMNLDVEYCADEGLAFVVSESLAAVWNAARDLWQDFQADPDAAWDPDGAKAFQTLGNFVVAALLGTATVTHPGRTLRDFGWKAGRSR
ncbi:MAG: NUDIX domain-containing protein [Rubrivivax sp.]